MPSIEKSDRLQKAILFAKTGENRDGQATLDPDPVEMDVRYTIGKGVGGFAAIQSAVIVDRVVSIDSVMKLCSLEEWAGTGSESREGEYLKVVSYKETKDIKVREVRRSVRLELYRGTPPPRD